MKLRTCLVFLSLFTSQLAAASVRPHVHAPSRVCTELLSALVNQSYELARVEIDMNESKEPAAAAAAIPTGSSGKNSFRYNLAMRKQITDSFEALKSDCLK